MKVKEILSHFEALGNESVRKHNLKYGAGPNQFGVKMGDIRKVASKIKKDHKLALELWETGNVEARYLATLIMDPKQLSAAELNQMVRSEEFAHVADWLYSNVIKVYPENESLRKDWMQTSDVMAARAGWNLTATRIARNPDGINIPEILNRIEKELGVSAPAIQWTMNIALANVGIYFPEYRERAIAIGEALGVYRDFPVSKGCTSPFAPIWIKEIVSRQK